MMLVAGAFCGPLAATFLVGIFTFLLSLCYSWKKQSYWKERNIPFVKPLLFLGSMYENTVNPLAVLEKKRYLTLGPIYGHYEMNRPLLSVGDPELLRDIFVKDFARFPIRRSYRSNDEMIDCMLNMLEGEDWKRVRSIITPTFSTGKLKRILGILQDCSKTLMENLRATAEKKEHIDAKRIFGAFTMNVIASSAFSTKIDSHNDPDNIFVQTAKKLFLPTLNWRLILFLISPRLLNWLNISLADQSIMNFFKNVTMQIIEKRKKTNQKRNDFLQLLIDASEETDVNEKKEDAEHEEDLARNYGQESAGQKVISTTSNKQLTINELVAQCVVFFLAGYNTGSSAISFASYLLATNEDVQEKARIEIAQCLKDTNGVLTYEALAKMKYLDNIISETLRLYPPTVRTDRRVESDCELGNTGIRLLKHMIITIPIYAMHHDPKYFPDPEKFDPDRFSLEERSKRSPYVYLPFGHGPRSCIGMRFALLEIKVCLVHVISSFNIKTCPQTMIPMEFHPHLIGSLIPKDVLLDMEPRHDCLLAS